MLPFHLLLAAFLTVAANTAPPQHINSIEDLTKTCVYIASVPEVPLPNSCVRVLKELTDCANTEANTNIEFCYALIGQPIGEE